MCRGRFGNGEFAALKLDMAKAYDRVKWNYSTVVILKMGYAEEWMEKVMNFVTVELFLT